MSAVTADRDATRVPSAGRGPSADHRPNLARLTAVELRKMVDTRAGFWLQVVSVALAVLVVVLVCIFGDARDQTLRTLLAGAVAPMGVLLPVVGILLVTSEWSQRTAMITFTLVPHRSRVLVAKLAAGTSLAIAAVVLCLVIAALGTAIAAPGVEHTWSLPVGFLGQTTVYVVTAMVMGVGFGAVLLNSAPAIVLYYVLPIAWSILGSISALTGVARWLDPSRSLSPLTDHLMSATEWARTGTSLALWMLVPVLAGLWRITRSEVQ
jgi:ABC-2 type transport system permease protein